MAEPLSGKASVFPECFHVSNFPHKVLRTEPRGDEGLHSPRPPPRPPPPESPELVRDHRALSLKVLGRRRAGRWETVWSTTSTDSSRATAGWATESLTAPTSPAASQTSGSNRSAPHRPILSPIKMGKNVYFA